MPNKTFGSTKRTHVKAAPPSTRRGCSPQHRRHSIARVKEVTPLEISCSDKFPPTTDLRATAPFNKYQYERGRVGRNIAFRFFFKPGTQVQDFVGKIGGDESGCEEGEAHIDWSMVMQRQHPLLELP